MALIVDPDLLTDKAVDDGTTEVFIDTAAKTIKLNTAGNLSTDGVTLKALYSFLKEEWRNDPFTKNLAAFEFPMVPITDESFEFVGGWDFLNDTARNLIRTAGWTVRNVSGNVTQMWAGIIGLGAIEANDQLYYQQASGAAPSNVVLTGQINQAAQIYRDDDGDGNTAEGSDFDRRAFFSLFAREAAQLYGVSSLGDIGVAALASQAYRFPISTAADLKIADTDANVAANAPYTAIAVRYFGQAFSRAVDSGATRDFGVVIDVGTHSGVDGSTGGGGNTLTTAAGGIVTAGNPYVGGTLTIHEGANAGIYPVTAVTSTTVTTSGTFGSALSNQSFTLQRAAPVAATAEQIYTKVQYLLRQSANINAAGAAVTGKTAAELLEFVGDTLKTLVTSNPNGGGSGVLIEGFQAGDTNRLVFADNAAAERTYPFVAVLTINFGDNLKNDPDAVYRVFFTTLPGAGNDFGEAGAIIADDNSGADMAGAVGGASSIQRTFNYDGNAQGGRTPGTDAPVTVVGIGLGAGQYVKATATIARSTANAAALVAALERNYANP